MYAIVFEKDKKPRVWKTISGWPGMFSLGNINQNTMYAYFFASKKWHLIQGSSNPLMHESDVPAHYRATVLLLT